MTEPFFITVAPNGARRTQSDHQAVPVTAKETAECARACMEAGAAMIHMHVRDDGQQHTLDTDLYLDATAAVREECGDGIVVQITTEAVGRYKTDQQMHIVRSVKPEAVSLAVREIFPETTNEKDSADFMEWLHKERIAPQFIVYSAEELNRFRNLCDRGIIPGRRHSLLFVLGKYSGVNARPDDLSNFEQAGLDNLDWSVCAFGPAELDCVLASYQRGGGARVGFENNVHMADGTLAPDNQSLVSQLASSVAGGVRELGTASQLRERMSQHLT